MSVVIQARIRLPLLLRVAIRALLRSIKLCPNIDRHTISFFGTEALATFVKPQATPNHKESKKCKDKQKNTGEYDVTGDAFPKCHREHENSHRNETKSRENLIQNLYPTEIEHV